MAFRLKSTFSVRNCTFCAVLVFMVLANPANAGDFSRKPDNTGHYDFTQCTEPTKPALTLDPKKSGNSAVLDYNAQVDRMNSWLRDVQSYMNCLSSEADGDLQTYYNAVSTSLTERQVAMQDDIDGLRQVLAKGPNRGKKRQAPAAVPALAGGDDEAPAVTP